MSSGEYRRSSRIVELDARRAQQAKTQKKSVGTQKDLSETKRARKKVKTTAMQDLVSDPAEQQAHKVGKQAPEVSDTFSNEDHHTKANEATPAKPGVTLPDISKLELLLTILQRRDSYEIFAEPVNPAEVEGYYDVIKYPTDFGTIAAKISEGKYKVLEEFEHDVFLVFSNAMLFNPSSTIYYRQARAIKEVAEKLFHALKTDPENFEFQFSAARQDGGRWTRAEARILNSTNPTTFTDCQGKKKSEDLALQRRLTYWPEALLTENESPASYVYNGRKPQIKVEPDFNYRESLMQFVKDLGPMAKYVAMRKLAQCTGGWFYPSKRNLN